MHTDIESGSDPASVSILSKRDNPISICGNPISKCDNPISVDVNAAALVAMALGHRLRMQILCKVAPFREHGLSAGSLSAQLMVVPSSLSYHLQQMTRAGVLIARHNGRSMLYSVNDNGVAALCDFLAGLRDQGKTRTSWASDED
jgi:ArsR family transcriptional regulator